MKKYLSTLHRRSERHKKNFALAVSGMVTLIIFSAWSMVNLGDKKELAKKNDNTRTPSEVSPMGSMRANVASSLEAIKGSIDGIKSSLESINVELEYEEMRDKALESYE